MLLRAPLVCICAASLLAAATPELKYRYRELPLGAVKPAGWLERQLRIQAAGLGGRLDEFWPDVGPRSGWLGGDGESWERGPYFLDGLLPLAYLLDDAALIAKARKFTEWTLTHQRPDGGIGPEKNKDWWPNMVMLKALTQYQEATGDARVVPLMEKYFRYHAAEMDARPLKEWAAYRWQDEVVSVLWLYQRTGDRKLIDFAGKLRRQGYDWKKHFAEFVFHDKVAKPQAKLNTHVVNNAMALKAMAEAWMVSGEAGDRDAVYKQLGELDRWHLLPSGAHAGDEHYAGTNPSQGTELCAVVEGMYSFERMLAILGDAAFGDRLEKLAYNALPATFSADMWAHQYDQQPNQVLCSVYPRAWTTNGKDSNLFGLEPNFGCCTSNFHQGWPKLVSHLWMSTNDGGLAAVAWAPARVTATVRGGVAVKLAVETEYPFRDSVKVTVSAAKASQFPLEFRIPAWAEGATVALNGVRQTGVKAGSFFRIERTWKPGDVVTLKFPMAVRTTRWFHDSMALERGPLVFSLAIGEDWRKLRERVPAQAADWEVHPTTPWNYALLPGDVKVTERAVGDVPFGSAAPAVELEARGRRLPAWGLENGSAGTLPQSPVASAEPMQALRLIPYGAAKLRITAFPVLER